MKTGGAPMNDKEYICHLEDELTRADIKIRISEKSNRALHRRNKALNNALTVTCSNAIKIFVLYEEKISGLLLENSRQAKVIESDSTYLNMYRRQV